MLAADPAHARAWNNLGLAQADAGRREEAIASYERAIVLDPTYADAVCHLGIALAKNGRFADAITRYEEAIRLDPDHAYARNNLGNLLKDLKRPDDAIPHFEAAIGLRPDLADIHSNYGAVLMRQGRFEEAEPRLREAVRLQPSSADLRFNLGNLLCDQFRFEAAVVEYDQALRLQPGFIEAHNNLANAYRNLGQLEAAEATLVGAIELDRDYRPAYSNLANILRELGRPDEAVEALEMALRLDPAQPETMAALSMALKEAGRLDEAIAWFDRALALKPEAAGGHNDVGMLYTELGRHDEAQAAFARAIGANQNLPVIHSNRLFAKLYMPNVPPAEIAADARAFGERFCDPLLRRRPFANGPDPDRRLRVGFVSADFRKHSVSFFFEPAVAHLVGDEIETFAYSHTLIADETTDRLKAAFDHWICIRKMSDDEAADRIEVDGIDILVDLSGHTSGNRLLLFARKPAPVQVSWIGYPGTTGLKAMDYRIADMTEPEDQDPALSIERLWRMPDMAVCYQASPRCPAVIDHPPCDDNGHVTFGCFNNYAKLSDDALATWAAILSRVPDSRLLLEIVNIDRPAIRDAAFGRFARAGLPLDRLDLEPRLPKNQYVLYNRIDIALDPFPYNGGTTSMDTLWMGVPFVALEGHHLVSRIGFAMLTTVGLPELIAGSPDEYASIAVALALDRERLRDTRRGLRERTARSPLMDHARFGRHLSEAFRGMWRAWLATQASSDAAQV